MGELQVSRTSLTTYIVVDQDKNVLFESDSLGKAREHAKRELLNSPIGGKRTISVIKSVTVETVMNVYEPRLVPIIRVKDLSAGLK